MAQEVSFHDNVIHSIEFIDEDFETTLVLSIDHITEWVKSGDGFEFKIVPVNLVFQNVSDLEIKLNKPGFTISSYLETILDLSIESAGDNRTNYTASLLNGNYIKFMASSHQLEVTGNPVLKSEQFLSVMERNNA